jgi:hypothetical protein
LASLRKHLEASYPLNVESANNKSDSGGDSNNTEILHIFFPPHQVTVGGFEDLLF